MSDDKFWNAIKHVESKGNENAENKTEKEHSIGPLQIQKRYYDDAVEFNELKLKKLGYAGYTWEDCKGPGSFKYSRVVAELYMERYANAGRLGREPTFEDMARIHNGGPNGYKWKDTIKYWEEVKKHLN